MARCTMAVAGVGTAPTGGSGAPPIDPPRGVPIGLAPTSAGPPTGPPTGAAIGVRGRLPIGARAGEGKPGRDIIAAPRKEDVETQTGEARESDVIGREHLGN